MNNYEIIMLNMFSPKNVLKFNLLLITFVIIQCISFYYSLDPIINRIVKTICLGTITFILSTRDKKVAGIFLFRVVVNVCFAMHFIDPLDFIICRMENAGTVLTVVRDQDNPLQSLEIGYIPNGSFKHNSWESWKKIDLTHRSMGTIPVHLRLMLLESIAARLRAKEKALHYTDHEMGMIKYICLRYNVTCFGGLSTQRAIDNDNKPSFWQPYSTPSLIDAINQELSIQRANYLQPR